MKRTSNRVLIFSLTSLVALASNSVFAEELSSVPTLEGGVTAMIGTFWAVPSADSEPFFTSRGAQIGMGEELLSLDSQQFNVNGHYDFGFQAAIGYVFEDTANDIELSYRELDSNADNSTSADLINDVPADVYSDQRNKYQNWDLMISQFLDLGTHMQMRFLGGLSYLSELDQTTHNNADFTAQSQRGFFIADVEAHEEVTSEYSGLGPRVGVDSRYDFGQGFGIVGGGSVAYFLGDLKNKSQSDLLLTVDVNGRPIIDANLVGLDAEETTESHAVTNLRANLAVDYVYFFDNEELTTMGLELGYEVDTYFNGVGYIDPIANDTNVSDITFSGPYLNLKGVF